MSQEIFEPLNRRLRILDPEEERLKKIEEKIDEILQLLRVYLVR